MRTASVLLSAFLCAGVPAQALAGEAAKVVPGLNYQIAQDGPQVLVQAVRVRPDTGQVLIRHTNGRTAWVDASELRAHRQPVATEAGGYLFVAAAIACLMDEHRCQLGVNRSASTPTRSKPADSPAQ